MKRLASILDMLRTQFEQQAVPRYQALSQRDQRILLILAAFLALTLPLFGVILPFNDALQSAREQVAELQLQSNEASRLADQLQRGGGAALASGSVMSQVDRIARSSGVRQYMTRIRPQAAAGGGETLLVHMKDAPYKESVSFLSALAEAGLGLTQLKLQAAESAGHIHFQAQITGG